MSHIGSFSNRITISGRIPGVRKHGYGAETMAFWRVYDTKQTHEERGIRWKSREQRVYWQWYRGADGTWRPHGQTLAPVPSYWPPPIVASCRGPSSQCKCCVSALHLLWDLGHILCSLGVQVSSTEKLGVILILF